MSQKISGNKKFKKHLIQLLLEKRGYVCKLPKSKNVILTMTGGIDSSVGAQLIIESWNSTIYPFYLKRGATAEKYELSNVTNVIKYLKQKYPTKIKGLMIASAPVPLVEIKPNFSRKRVVKIGHPLRNSIIQSYAVQYGVSLNDQDIDLNTILVGSVASDHFPGSRDIDLILNTLYVCMNLEEWKWQILSPFFQPGILKHKDKVNKIDLIKWGHKNGFPFELTRTCTFGDLLPCGKCSECKERIETFEKAKIKDPIKYNL